MPPRTRSAAEAKDRCTAFAGCDEVLQILGETEELGPGPSGGNAHAENLDVLVEGVVIGLLEPEELSAAPGKGRPDEVLDPVPGLVAVIVLVELENHTDGPI